MKNRFNKGELNEGILILFALCIIIFVFIIPEKKLGPIPGIFNSINDKSQWDLYNQNQNTIKPDSIFGSSIIVGSGNAPYEYDPFSEYITLESKSNKLIDITGWSLKNSKDTKTFELSGNTIHYTLDSMQIPQAAKYLSPTNENKFEDVILNEGDRVIVSSGSSGINTPYKIVSFKENVCSGFLDMDKTYKFTPPLERDCPSLKNESGFNSLDKQCKDYVYSIPNCYTPTYDGVDQNRQSCVGCVDGKSNLSSSCVNFIKQHSSYDMCIYNHKDDPNFSKKTWRIFLGRSFEMWDKNEETISLLDNVGKLVNYYSY